MTTPTRDELLKLAKEAGAREISDTHMMWASDDLALDRPALDRFAELLSAHQAQAEPVTGAVDELPPQPETDPETFLRVCHQHAGGYGQRQDERVTQFNDAELINLGRSLAALSRAQQAPAPRLAGEYPPIDTKDFDSDSDLWTYLDAWRNAAPGMDSGEKAEWACKHIHRLMRAYVDADRAAQAGQLQQAPADGLMVDIGPPATSRDRWMYEQGRLAERDPRTHAGKSAAPVSEQATQEQSQ